MVGAVAMLGRPGNLVVDKAAQSLLVALVVNMPVVRGALRRHLRVQGQGQGPQGVSGIGKGSLSVGQNSTGIRGG